MKVKKVNTREDFLKLHVCMDVETGLVLSFFITDGTRTASKQMLKFLRYLPKIAKCLGDPASS